MEQTHRVIFIDLPEQTSRSISPMSNNSSSTSPCRMRNLGFFQTLSNRFSRRSKQQDEFCLNNEDDSNSLSTDSCSSTSVDNCVSLNDKDNRIAKVGNLELSSSSSSSSGSDSGSDSTRRSQLKAERLSTARRSSSSIRNAFKNLTMSSRSHSCSSTPLKECHPKKLKKITPEPKKILRQPVSYAYLKGMSGLPTQRVPRSSLNCCQYR